MSGIGLEAAAVRARFMGIDPSLASAEAAPQGRKYPRIWDEIGLAGFRGFRRLKTLSQFSAGGPSAAPRLRGTPKFEKAARVLISL